MLTSDRKYSPEVIRRYRELDGRGEFKRKIQQRSPVAPNYDEVLLECGHRGEYDVRLLDRMFPAASSTLNCNQCASDWLEAAQGAEGKQA